MYDTFLQIQAIVQNIQLIAQSGHKKGVPESFPDRHASLLFILQKKLLSFLFLILLFLQLLLLHTLRFFQTFHET